jgi:ribosomal protein S5
MQVWPRPLGFGITANPVITELCDLAGLHNVTVKVSGNRKNLRNLVQVRGTGLCLIAVAAAALCCALPAVLHPVVVVSGTGVWCMRCSGRCET